MQTSLRSYALPILFFLLGGALYGTFAYDLERSDFIRLFTLTASLFVVSWRLIKMLGWNFWLLAGIGLTFRLIFLPALPNLSQDFYRFLWDGRLLLQGINPYLFTPDYLISEDSDILPQAMELYRGMGSLSAGHFSNYPPVNQLFFGLAALLAGKSIVGSVVVLRLVILLADLGILYFGKKLMEQLNIPASHIFWYFLNPFIIIELTGNLHFEGVMLFFFIWALYLLIKGNWVASALLIGVSISVKLIPLIFLPLFYRYFVTKGIFSRGFWKLKKFFWLIIATVLLSFLPFISVEFLYNFSQTVGLWFTDFEFNASVHYLVRWISFETIGWNLIYITGKVFAGIVFAVILAMAIFRKNNHPILLMSSMLLAISLYFVLSTTVHPWYVATPLLLCLFTPYRFPLLWSFLVMLSYSAYGTDGFQENLWLIGVEYLAVIGYFLWEFKRSKIIQIQPK